MDENAPEESRSPFRTQDGSDLTQPETLGQPHVPRSTEAGSPTSPKYGAPTFQHVAWR